MDNMASIPPSGQRAEIEALIRQLHLVRIEGDFEGIAKLIHPDAVFEFIGQRPFFQQAGVYRGRDEIVHAFKQLHLEVALLDAELLDLVVEGNHAFSRRRMSFQHRGTGKRALQEVWDVSYFQDGLLLEGRRLLDTHAFEQLKSD